MPNAILNNNDPIILGMDNDPTGRNFNGDLDEVKLYNRALSSNEIAAIATAGSGGVCAVTHGLSPPRIDGFHLETTDLGPRFTVQWTAAPGTLLRLEISFDLSRWQPATAVISETRPGVFSAVLPIHPAGSAFFRLRRENE